MDNSLLLDDRGHDLRSRFRGPHSAHAAGGRASGAKLTDQERSDKARKAAQIRWAREMAKYQARLDREQKSREQKRNQEAA